MGYVEFPGLVIRTEFGTLSEKFLNYWVVLFIPINFGLRHQDWDVFLQTLVKLLQRFFNTIVIFSQSGILDTFGELSQRINVSVSDDIEFSERFLRWSFLEDDGIDELEIILVGHFVSELRILGQDISCHIVIPEFTVE